MSRSKIRIVPTQYPETFCDVHECTRFAVRDLLVDEGSVSDVLVHRSRFCLAHLRMLRDVVAERVG